MTREIEAHGVSYDRKGDSDYWVLLYGQPIGVARRAGQRWLPCDLSATSDSVATSRATRAQAAITLVALHEEGKAK
jgi:hypothetical protein